MGWLTRVLRGAALRRGFGYGVVLLLVIGGATRLSLEPTIRDFGTLSTTLMMADLGLEDLATSLRSPPRPSGRVVIVDLKPHRPNRRFSFPQPRGRYAPLLDRLFAMGARVVAFDLVFQQDTEKPQEDQAFLKGLRDHAGKVVVARLPLEAPQGLRWDALASGVEAAVDDPHLGPGYGTTLALLDVDGVLRRTPVVWAQSSFRGGRTLPAVALSRALGAPAELSDGRLVIGSLVSPLGLDGTIDLRVPDYMASGLDVAMDEVLEGVCNPAPFKDAIVLVVPPMDVDRILVRGEGVTKKPVPGGYVVAATIDALLQGHAMRRGPDELVWAAVCVLSLLAAAIMWVRPTLQGLVLGVAALGTLWALVVVVILRVTDVWIDAAVPLFALVATSVGLLAWDAALLRGVFARFLPKTLVDHALSAGFDREHQKGTVSDATVVFVDLHGYTGISERLSGQDLVSLVNQLHETLGGVFQAQGGTIVDYMGDAQMIVFGIPKALPNHASAAVRAVLAVPDALRSLNVRLTDETHDDTGDLRVGVGIASGPVTWGFIGAYGHQEFAALGDTTNTAARLQSMTRAQGVTCLISDATYQLVKDEVQARRIEGAVIRGKAVQHDIYELILP